jgi:hypothetical protein
MPIGATGMGGHDWGGFGRPFTVAAMPSAC